MLGLLLYLSVGLCFGQSQVYYYYLQLLLLLSMSVHILTFALGFLDSSRDSDTKPEDLYAFFYYLFCLLLVTTCLTFITTPYVALFQVYFLSFFPSFIFFLTPLPPTKKKKDIAPYYHVRTKLVALGEFFSFVGSVITLGMMGIILLRNEHHIQVYFILFFFKKKTHFFGTGWLFSCWLYFCTIFVLYPSNSVFIY